MGSLMVTIAPADAMLVEAASLLARNPAETKGIWRVRLIEADVQGSSGFYPADVIRRDGPGAFPAGTHVYYDHPSSSEEDDRPERSVKDIAGYILDTPSYENGPDGHGLFSRIQFTEAAKNHVRDIAHVIGLSIRAAGEIEETEQGRIVRSIREGLSVDLVTRAGAGGRLVAMTESATAPESPPAAAPTTAAPVRESVIPSTNGTGTLVNEVAELKESVSDAIDALKAEISRLAQSIQESRQETARFTRDAAKATETQTFLRERAEEADRRLRESESNNAILEAVLKSGLPAASQARVVKAFVPGHTDIHESITVEREYLKKVMRESDRSEITGTRETGLGLSESANSVFSAPGGSTASDTEISEISDLLLGGAY